MSIVLTGTSPLALSKSEKVDVRRFCGYPVYGSGTTDDPYFRFETGYVQLESHMANLQYTEIAVVRSKLTDLRALDAAIVAASSSLVVDQAAVFKRNPREMAERAALYRARRLDLCQFLGVPAGENLKSGGNSIRLVV